MVTIDRIFMVLGLLSAGINVFAHFDKGFNSYGWPLACCFWILTAWIKTEHIQSLNKNK